MENIMEIKPFDNCPALNGYHCQTNSLAKIFHYYNHPLSEDMILGLGAGMGFIYWKMKIGSSDYVFVGGRTNLKNFYLDLGNRTGIEINTISTSSATKAEALLLEKLSKKEPVMVYADMGYLPWFDLPEDYHFGGHTFIICGFDDKKTALASDIEQTGSGLKKGFYYPISLEQLRKARNSIYKPFPPKNTYLNFDFKNYHNPTKEDICSSINQTIESQLNPPIKNLGIKGIRHTAKEILKWPNNYNENELRMNLFSLYIYIEIGGTGGGCFRYMYSRFLEESSKITGNQDLSKVAEMINKSANVFSEIGGMFKNAENATDLEEKIKDASNKFNEIAEIEENSFNLLKTIISKV